jgi:hypothetical protein
MHGRNSHDATAVFRQPGDFSAQSLESGVVCRGGGLS